MKSSKATIDALVKTLEALKLQWTADNVKALSQINDDSKNIRQGTPQSE